MNSNDFKDTDDRKIASFDHASCNDHTRMLKILSYYMPDQYHIPLAAYIKMLELQHLFRTPVHNFRHAAKPSDPPFEQTDFSETVSSQMNTSSSDAASPQLNASSSQETDISTLSLLQCPGKGNAGKYDALSADYSAVSQHVGND